jgi:hypothetical protein
MGRSALLAQLVEHLHGKEGVDGSSPSEGLQRSPVKAVFLSPRPATRAARRVRDGYSGCARRLESRTV